MDRREFIALSGTGLLGLVLSGKYMQAAAKSLKGPKKYSIVILGDTHFDTEPASVYHSHYNEKVEWLNRVQRAEFKRNGEMWRERCPRLLKRAARLIDKDTVMVFQMGDLIQGDCGDGEVHKKMLGDVMTDFKKELGGLPFVTVVGNHDIRGTDAEKAYHEFMPQRMSMELGKKIEKTNFDFYIGKDAYIVIDFNTPDDAEVDRLLKETEGARHTFIIDHGPIFPSDDGSPRWIYHGKNTPEDIQARLHFRREFARRNAIVLCGHTHRTEFADWYGDGGRITQITMNSVWYKDEIGKYVIDAQGPEQYGMLRAKMTKNANGSKANPETAFFDEYRPGLRRYSHSPAAGCYKMYVTPKHVRIDFYAGDSEDVSQTFEVR